MLENKSETIQKSSNEDTTSGFRRHSIVTIDSILTTRQSRRTTEDNLEDSKDVVYSSVVQPDQLKRTLDLYKRLDVIPTDRETVIEGHKFYDCNTVPDREKIKAKAPQMPEVLINLEPQSKVNKVPKKNAFYTSKYLVVEPKSKDTQKGIRRQGSSTDDEILKNVMDRQSLDINAVAKEEVRRKRLRSGIKDIAPTKAFTDTPTPQMTRIHQHQDTRKKSEPVILYPVTSSESEFEVEKSRRLTVSSNSSFDLDEYYSTIMTNRAKLQEPRSK